jgi:hypothetical protein
MPYRISNIEEGDPQYFEPRAVVVLCCGGACGAVVAQAQGPRQEPRNMNI